MEKKIKLFARIGRKAVMKVNSYTGITQIMNRVTDKSGDKQGGAGSNAYERQQNQKKKDEDEIVVTDEAVEDAIHRFAGEEANLQQGITVSAEGSGPGLKVVLKDAAGGILRSISGEEFVKLREAVSAGQRSGRILDQKV